MENPGFLVISKGTPYHINYMENKFE